MRILAFSDLHRDAEAAGQIVAESRAADVVIGAGDFATRAQGTSDTLSVLRDISCPFILVHGNHDDPVELSAMIAKFPNGHLLHGSAVSIGAATFFGIGGEMPIRNCEQWNVGLSESDGAKLLQSCPRGAVLVSHTPPFGHCDVQRDGANEGSTAILDCVQTKKPSHVICGHIHNAWGMRSQLNNSLIHNVGPKFVWHDI